MNEFEQNFAVIAGTQDYLVFASKPALSAGPPREIPIVARLLRPRIGDTFITATASGVGGQLLDRIRIPSGLTEASGLFYANAVGTLNLQFSSNGLVDPQPSADVVVTA